ncbi:MAG: mandelate racemase/muconate lactonizing enzyme family protein [Anaerolineales bacterium]|jgi:galactonate dehydratase
MKITNIESLRFGDLPRLLIVRLHTDAGLIGIGETVDKIPGAAGALHGTIAPLLLGQSAFDIEGNWRFIFDNLMYHGYSGAELRALSAVEMAMWDLLGKAHEIPLYRLLGGSVRDSVPTYNTCIGFADWDDYRSWHDPDRDAGELARSLLEDGINAMKIWPFDPFSERSLGQYISPKEIEMGLRPIRQIREAVGEKMELGIEFHFRWNRASAERIARALEPFNILFLEDTLPAVNLDEIRLLALRTSIPIVGSELLMTRWQVREWLEKHVSQYLMTDPVWNGGIAETRKIANMAEAFGVPVILHNVAGPFCHAACLHLGAHLPNLVFAESVRAFYRSYFSEISDYEVQLEEGRFMVPEAPGLGVNLRAEVFERPDLIRQASAGEGLAAGRRAMGDHWEREEIR